MVTFDHVVVNNLTDFRRVFEEGGDLSKNEGSFLQSSANAPKACRGPKTREQI